MRIPVAMRVGVLLVLVSLLTACGGESAPDGGTPSVAGTYRLDVGKSVEQAVEMTLVHDADWMAARTDEARGQAQQALKERTAVAFQVRARDTLTLREDGTFAFVPGPGPHVSAGTWTLVDTEVTLLYERGPSNPSGARHTERLLYLAGSLLAHPEVVERIRNRYECEHLSPWFDPILHPVWTRG